MKGTPANPADRAIESSYGSANQYNITEYFESEASHGHGMGGTSGGPSINNTGLTGYTVQDGASDYWQPYFNVKYYMRIK